MGNKETAEREFAQALVKELQELHTRNYLREIGIVPTQILFAAKHTIEELLRQVAVLETERALREAVPQPQPQVEPVAWQYRRNDSSEWVTLPHWPCLLGDGDERRPLYAAPPRPQASAEDVELVGRYVTAHKSLKTYLHDAWQRIRASLGVGQ